MQEKERWAEPTLRAMDVRPIEYAPPLPMHKRRHVRRRIFAITTLLIGIPLAWYAGPRAWRHAELLYWQDKALNYSPPADQVVFDNDPDRVTGLLKSPEYKSVTNEIWETAAIRVAVPCDRFTRLASPPGIIPAATVFLHERRNSRGERRLVLLQAGPNSLTYSYRTPGGRYREEAIIYRLGTPFSNPVELIAPRIGAQHFQMQRPVRYFAGQVEPDDASHFSIAYEIDGKREVIDGWLMDDDTIKLEKRR